MDINAILINAYQRNKDVLFCDMPFVNSSPYYWFVEFGLTIPESLSLFRQLMEQNHDILYMIPPDFDNGEPIFRIIVNAVTQYFRGEFYDFLLVNLEYQNFVRSKMKEMIDAFPVSRVRDSAIQVISDSKPTLGFIKSEYHEYVRINSEKLVRDIGEGKWLSLDYRFANDMLIRMHQNPIPYVKYDNMVRWHFAFERAGFNLLGQDNRRV